MHEDSACGGAGTPECAGVGGVRFERLADLLRRGGRASGEADGDGEGVAVDHGDAVAGGGDAERRAGVHVEDFGEAGRGGRGGGGARWFGRGGTFGGVLRIDETAEDFQDLPLHLLLFSTYIGHDVVEHIERRRAWVSRARDRLKSSDEAGVEGSKRTLKSGEGDDEARGGAVGVGDDESFAEGRRVEGALVGDDGEVRGVDEWNDERDVWIPTVVFRIGEHGELSSSKGSFFIDRNKNLIVKAFEVVRRTLTDVAGDLRVQARKDDEAVAKVLWNALSDDELAHGIRYGRGELPVDGELVFLACRTLRSAEGGDDEERVVFEERDEALADGACCAEDADVYLPTFEHRRRCRW